MLDKNKAVVFDKGAGAAIVVFLMLAYTVLAVAGEPMLDTLAAATALGSGWVVTGLRITGESPVVTSLNLSWSAPERDGKPHLRILKAA